MRVSNVVLLAIQSACSSHDPDATQSTADLPPINRACEVFVPTQEEVAAAMPVFVADAVLYREPCLVLQVDSPELSGCFNSAGWGKALFGMRESLALAAQPLPVCAVCFGSNEINAFGVDGKVIERASLDPVAATRDAAISARTSFGNPMNCDFGE